MKTFRITLLTMVFGFSACAPKAIIVNSNDPRIEQSAVPAISQAKVVIDQAASKLTEQGNLLDQMDTHIGGAFKYSQLIRSHAQSDAQAIAFFDGLDHSLDDIQSKHSSLVNTNRWLLHGITSSSNSLDQALELARLKDQESIEWQQLSRRKDLAMAKVKQQLTDVANKSADLRLKLEDAMVYKKIVIGLVALTFLFGIIKVALKIWFPFPTFKV